MATGAAGISYSANTKTNLKRLLECSICLETFDDPCTLPCLHSFCRKCLEEFVEENFENDLNCPVCRSTFTLDEAGVAGMTKNHFICNMVEVMSIQDEGKCIPCTHCQKPSVGRCVTCELFMCEKCLKPHNDYPGFQDHDVLTMEELSKPENQSKIKGRSRCKKHASKKLKLYCETCEELICTYCMAFEHVRPDHLCFPLEEIAEKKRNDLRTIFQTLEDNDEYSQFEFNTERTLNTCRRNLVEAKRRINERKTEVMGFVQNVLEKKTQLLSDEMDRVYDEKMQKINDETIRMQGHFEERKKTADMAKALLDHGSNEEILMSHNSIKKNVTKCQQYQWGDVNVDILLRNNNQLDTLFLDEVRSIKKDTELDKSNGNEVINDDAMKHDITTSTTVKRDKLVLYTNTRKLMIVNEAKKSSLDHIDAKVMLWM